jgi:curved DNA binding protein
MTIAAGDIVKIDLGVHISGYIAVAANSIVVGALAAAEAPVTGEKANVFHAAQGMSKAIVATLKAGNTNTHVVDACKKVLEAYPGVKCVEGVTMHQMKRYIIDGNKTIIVRPADENGKVEKVTFEENEVYAVDVCVSSGEGTPRENGTGNGGRTTIYKRQVDKTYQLKMAASRKVFNEINQRFPTMPFTMRALEDEKTAKLGIRECVIHDLLSSYSVVYERPGDHVVHVRFTLLLLPSGTLKITGVNCTPVTEDNLTIFGAPADLTAIDPELAAIVSAPEKVKAKKDKKKKK